MCITSIFLVFALLSAFFQGQEEASSNYDVSDFLSWSGWLDDLGPEWSIIQHPLAAFCEAPKPTWTSFLSWDEPEQEGSLREMFCNVVQGLLSFGLAPPAHEESWGLVGVLDMPDVFWFADDKTEAGPSTWWDVFPLSSVRCLLDRISDIGNNAGTTETTLSSPLDYPKSPGYHLFEFSNWLSSISASIDDPAPNVSEKPVPEPLNEAATWHWWMELLLLDRRPAAFLPSNEEEQADPHALKDDARSNMADVAVTGWSQRRHDMFWIFLAYCVFCMVVAPVGLVTACILYACWHEVLQLGIRKYRANITVPTDTTDRTLTPLTTRKGYPTFCDMGSEFPMVILWAIEQFALIKDIPCVPKVIQGSSLKYLKEAGVVPCAGGGEFSKVLVAKMNGAVKVAVKLFKKTGCDLMDVLSEAATAEWLSETGATPATYGIVALDNPGKFHELALVSEFIPDHRRSFNKMSLKLSALRSAFRKVLVNVVQLLQYIHMKRILHNNLSPDNILMTYQDGELVPYITGFRLSSFRNRQVCYAEAESYPSFESFHKRFPHVAPETYLQGQVTEKSDVYSMGGLLLKHARCANDPQVADVAVLCQAMEPRGRPTVDELLEMLQGLC